MFGQQRISKISYRCLRHGTWWTVRSTPNMTLIQRSSILCHIASNSDSGPYYEIHKRCLRRYYMAPWSLDEIQECRKDVFGKLETNLVEFLYHKIGGIPRYVLQVAEVCLVQGLDRKEIEDRSYCLVQEPIDEVEDIAKLLQYISQAKEHSSQLLHCWPKEDATGSSYISKSNLSTLNRHFRVH